MWWKTLMLPVAIIGVLFGVGEAQKAGKPQAVKPGRVVASARLATNDAILARFLSINPECKSPRSGAIASECRSSYCSEFNPSDPWCGVRLAQESGTSAPPPPPPSDSGSGTSAPPPPPPSGGEYHPPTDGSYTPPPSGAYTPPTSGDYQPPSPPPPPPPGTYPQYQQPTNQPYDGSHPPPPPGTYPGQQPGSYQQPNFSPPPYPEGGGFQPPGFPNSGQQQYPGQGPYGQQPYDQQRYGQYGSQPPFADQQQHRDLPPDLIGKCTDPESCKAFCQGGGEGASCGDARRYLEQKQRSEQYQQFRRGGPPGGEGFGPPGGGGGQGEGFGPPGGGDECKKGVAQGSKQISKMFAGMERRLAAMAKKGVNVESAQGIIDQLKALVERMTNLEDCSEMMEIGPMMGELMHELQEKLQGLERLQAVPQFIKQVERDAKRQTTRLQRAIAKLQRQKTQVDTSEATNLAGQITACVEQGKSQAAAGDESAFETLESCRELLEDLNEKVNVVEALSNLNRQQGRIKSEIARAKRDLNQAVRRKLETSGAEAALAEAERGLSELKEVIASGDLNQITDLLAGIEAALDSFRDQIDELLGRASFQYKKQFGDVETPDSIKDFVAKPPSFLF